MPECFDQRNAGYLPPIVRSSPEGPPDADSVLGAERVAGKTHNAEIAFFRVHAVTLDFDKNAHGA